LQASLRLAGSASLSSVMIAPLGNLRFYAVYKLYLVLHCNKIRQFFY
jgi:hypothetical protein